MTADEGVQRIEEVVTWAAGGQVRATDNRLEQYKIEKQKILLISTLFLSEFFKFDIRPYWNCIKESKIDETRRDHEFAGGQATGNRQFTQHHPMHSADRDIAFACGCMGVLHALQ